MKEQWCASQKNAPLSCSGLKVLVFSLSYGVGTGREPEEWDLGAGRVAVHGDDFREVTTLELGS